MSLKQELDQTIGEWALLNSRFYNAWNTGELPKSALMQYAEEYGNFIRLLPIGWDTLNDMETVEEENEHIRLWDIFADALGTQVRESTNPAVATLMSTANKLFSSQITAMGAMYAFEAQQPETASSKLEGLQKYYPVPAEGEEYFKVHAVNHHESEKLITRMTALSQVDEEQAIKACEEMSKALWDALEGIYDTTMEN